jgi:hypothetical protein
MVLECVGDKVLKELPQLGWITYYCWQVPGFCLRFYVID